MTNRLRAANYTEILDFFAFHTFCYVVKIFIGLIVVATDELII